MESFAMEHALERCEMWRGNEYKTLYGKSYRFYGDLLWRDLDKSLIQTEFIQNDLWKKKSSLLLRIEIISHPMRNNRPKNTDFGNAFITIAFFLHLSMLRHGHYFFYVPPIFWVDYIDWWIRFARMNTGNSCDSYAYSANDLCIETESR